VFGNYSMVNGGRFNTVSANYGSVNGGCSNRVVSRGSTIAGGVNNTVTNIGCCSLIGSGSFNTVSNSFSFIGGGCSNHACANFTSIIGGQNNAATCSNSHILGSNITTNRVDTTYVNNFAVCGDNTLTTVVVNNIPTELDYSSLPVGAIYRCTNFGSTDTSLHIKLV
jgi:hypothetical protein